MSNTIMQHEPQQDPRTTKLPESPRELAPGALPEAHSGGRGVWVWLVVLLLIAGIVTLVIYRRHGQSGQAGGPGGARGGMANFPVPVVAGVVSKQDVPIYLDGLGTVQAFNTVTVRSRVDGQLQKIMFTEGAEVKAGQVLAQIDPEPLKTQVAQAEAKKAQDEAQLANAQIELRRDEALFKDKILAQDAFDTQKALVQQLQAAVQADQAALANTKVQLGYTTIDAPIAGRVGIRQVDQGNMIHATDSNGLVVLTQLKPISVLFTLPEQTLREIQKQRSSEPMTVVAMDRDNKTELDRGQLTVIDNQIDITTGTIKIKAAFPNENLKLWPGQFVNARLLL
ncbi:MAG TPA: efflux RND transporter periplasmic adaptor subunit, partial [Verrucomicrobiae bacterium]